MDTDGQPQRHDAGNGVARPKDPASPKDGPGDFDRRRRARNWAMLLVLLGLSALFYAITLVKLAKGA
jgi:hypothetical protein